MQLFSVHFLVMLFPPNVIFFRLEMRDLAFCSFNQKLECVSNLENVLKTQWVLVFCIQKKLHGWGKAILFLNFCVWLEFDSSMRDPCCHWWQGRLDAVTYKGVPTCGNHLKVKMVRNLWRTNAVVWSCTFLVADGLCRWCFANKKKLKVKHEDGKWISFIEHFCSCLMHTLRGSTG